MKRTGFFPSLLLFFLLAILPVSGSAQNVLSISDTSGCPGDSIDVIISLSSTDLDVDSFGLELTYCPDMIDYVGFERGDLVQTFNLFDCALVVPGVLRVGGLDFSESIPAGSDGTLITISFNVTCWACQQGDVCIMDLINIADDIVPFSIDQGTFTQPCVGPTFTPTPEFTDTPVIPTDTPIPTDTAPSIANGYTDSFNG